VEAELVAVATAVVAVQVDIFTSQTLTFQRAH
jgi:hypothetical protein